MHGPFIAGGVNETFARARGAAHWAGFHLLKATLSFGGTPQTVEIARTGGKCADVGSGKLEIEVCNANAAGQRFTHNGAELVGSGGKCLQPSANANHATVVLATCTGAAAQSWTVKGNELVNGGGRCLDLAFGKTTDGNIVQIYDCYDNANQQWTLNAVK